MDLGNSNHTSSKMNYCLPQEERCNSTITNLGGCIINAFIDWKIDLIYKIRVV